MPVPELSGVHWSRVQANEPLQESKAFNTEKQGDRSEGHGEENMALLAVHFRPARSAHNSYFSVELRASPPVSPCKKSLLDYLYTRLLNCLTA
jgi:hypothetical protein